MPIQIQYGSITDAMELARQAGRGPVALQGRQMRSAEADRLIGRVLQGRQIDDQRRANEMTNALNQQRLRQSAAAGERDSQLAMLKFDAASQHAKAGRELAERKFEAEKKEAADLESYRKSQGERADRRMSLENQWKENARKDREEAAIVKAKIEAAEKAQEAADERVEKEEGRLEQNRKQAVIQRDFAAKQLREQQRALERGRADASNAIGKIHPSRRSELKALERNVAIAKGRLRQKNKAVEEAQSRYDEMLRSGEMVARAGGDVAAMKAGGRGQTKTLRVQVGGVGTFDVPCPAAVQPSAWEADEGDNINLFPEARRAIGEQFVTAVAPKIEHNLKAAGESPESIKRVFKSQFRRYVIAAGWSMMPTE